MKPLTHTVRYRRLRQIFEERLVLSTFCLPSFHYYPLLMIATCEQVLIADRWEREDLCVFFCYPWMVVFSRWNAVYLCSSLIEPRVGGLSQKSLRPTEISVRYQFVVQEILLLRPLSGRDKRFRAGGDKSARLVATRVGRARHQRKLILRGSIKWNVCFVRAARLVALIELSRTSDLNTIRGLSGAPHCSVSGVSRPIPLNQKDDLLLCVIASGMPDRPGNASTPKLSGYI